MKVTSVDFGKAAMKLNGGFGLFVFCQLIVSFDFARGQRIAPDGLFSVADLKIQNEKLSEVLNDIRAEIRAVKDGLSSEIADLNHKLFTINPSCKELHSAFPRYPSGTVTLSFADGEQHAVYCDMETLDGGWTLVQRSVWNWTETSQLITGYQDFLNSSVGSPEFGRAFRLPGKLWPTLQQTSDGSVDNMFKFYLRDEIPHDCTANPVGEGGVVLAPPLIHGTVGTRWTFPEEQKDVSLSPGTAASPGGEPRYLFNYASDSYFISSDATFGTCSPDSTVPFLYVNCCNNCWSYFHSISPWVDDMPHPMVHRTMMDAPDFYSRTLDDVLTMGGCHRVGSTESYYGAAVIEYYIR
eukprot:GCRY01002467.1.p1 GENE.GCRY01002467.1~~GCRY01002467.1.p1  ORF type:complete len:378 (-),score=33.74 GCRY01002467.1:299-1357(-)